MGQPGPPRLPGPHEEISDWQMRAACRGVDTSLFYSPDGERGRARAERERRAKEMCLRCPVVAACRAYALAVEEPYGTWGGLSETERNHLLVRNASSPQVETRLMSGCAPAKHYRGRSVYPSVSRDDSHPSGVGSTACRGL